MNELYRFLTFKLSADWHRLEPSERDAQKREFAAALRASDVPAHVYSLVGTRADADLLLWAIGRELEELRRLEAHLRGTALWAYSARPYAYLAARRKSKYLGEHAHADAEHARASAGPVGDRPYLVVYPMTKLRSWYRLPVEERTRIMAGHFAIGHRYPGVRIHTAYSFGLDDQEFVVSFEVQDVRDFLALVADLRESEASAYTQSETPIFVGTACTIEEALELADGTAVRETALR
jgi:chlorite dismutase